MLKQGGALKRFKESDNFMNMVKDLGISKSAT